MQLRKKSNLQRVGLSEDGTKGDEHRRCVEVRLHTHNCCSVRTGIVLFQFCAFLNMKGKGPNAKREIENWVACAHHTRDCVFAYRDERLHAYFDAKPSGIHCLAGISNERLASGLEITPSTVHETVD